MSAVRQTEYRPDLVLPPGETLKETLQALDMPQNELAMRMGRPEKTISEIVNAKTIITADTALQLEKVLGIPAGFWLSLESNYRGFLARAEDRKRLLADVDWPKQFRIKEMIKYGWIEAARDGVEQLNELLRFFGVASREEWATWWRKMETAFRIAQSVKVDDLALAAWLRQGEVQAQKMQCDPFSADGFKQALSRIRNMTRDYQAFDDAVIEACAECGVALVFVPQMPNSGVSGAARWLASDKALIELSLRYKKNDQLWFSFFHEAYHLLHDLKKEIFLDASAGSRGVKYDDDRANRWAADFLILPAAWQKLIEHKQISKRLIREFAQSIGVAEGIVVGRLQREGKLPYDHCNDLKVKLEWSPRPL